MPIKGLLGPLRYRQHRETLDSGQQMQESNSRKGWGLGRSCRALGRLFRDNAGNTLAIVGAALIPITAMIGSGVDISRAYMAKSRMQSACDAASLAARRVMKNDDLNDNVTDTGKEFFNFNFPQGLYETAAFEPVITKTGPGLINIDAETRIPTTVMRLFGFTTLPLEVSCEASLNFVNTDVVLVLDVTGSMADSVDGTPKIEALREAVLALYDELAPVQKQLQDQGLRLRYGIVPYSSTVNVGRLITAVDEDYITSSTPYQTRMAKYSTKSGSTYKFNSWVYQQSTFDTSSFKKDDGHITLATDTSGSTTSSKTYNLQDLATNVSGVAKKDFIWNGCIEERSTSNSIKDTSGFTIPSTAYDLNVNKIPEDDNTRWRPMLPEAIFDSSGWSWCAKTDSKGKCTDSRSSNAVAEVPADQGYSACPYESRRLQEWDRDDLDKYLDDLQPVGGTYHDIGMIWGARLISTGGIFADGCEEYNNMPCNRHIIFMTDGAQTAYCNVYSAYGLEQRDKRVIGNQTCSSSDQLARHQQRFKMICNAARGMDVSIWVVAFDTSLNANLKSCADNDSQTSTATKKDDLIKNFREIGNRIGALRLTQ